MSGANLRARLAEIRQQIASLEAQMASLRSEEELVARDLGALVYPVLTLPNDVVSEIFIQYVNGLPKGSPLCLLWVCRSWREVALSTCRLWTRFWRFDSKSNQHLVDALTLRLAQSGSLPLDLGASLPPAPWNGADAFFAGGGGRWRYAHLGFGHTFICNLYLLLPCSTRARAHCL
ncbi:hypothetical protein FB45DRAFT_297627 [Roridomyces roridus]|uniref:F-box domain-containing protein n=1 Tax=Roridomyces roridus TaxID=1738132 RepID=A0AAD7FUY9_9AGAR|nr:hypothetical protein FB45DRAFT_297627 [Roridomyces roridus]